MLSVREKTFTRLLLGYQLVHARDQNGNLLYDNDGDPIKVKEIPEVEAKHRGCPVCMQLRDGVKNEDVAKAAPILKKLTGPIVVNQIQEAGKKKPTWIAQFSVNAVPVLAELRAARNCPTRGTLEFLSRGNWITPEHRDVVIEEIPTYEQIADEATVLFDKGASIETIARALKTSWETVQAALEFNRTGKRPAAKPAGKKARKRNGLPKYQAISKDVAHRRDEKTKPSPILRRTWAYLKAQ